MRLDERQTVEGASSWLWTAWQGMGARPLPTPDPILAPVHSARGHPSFAGELDLPTSSTPMEAFLANRTLSGLDKQA